MTASLPSTTFERYRALLAELEVLISQTETRVLDSTPDMLFSNNVNFFVKSYLVTLCTYLEAFLQDRAVEVLERISESVSRTCIPSNIVRWSLSRDDVKDKDLSFAPLSLNITRKEIGEKLSGNPQKTIRLFSLLGIDLTADCNFDSKKAIVGEVVGKRNRIVHQNDSAGDITFGDIVRWKADFLEYMHAVDMCASH